MDRKRKNRGRHHARRRRGKSSDPFAMLPDELVMAVINAVGDPASLGKLALASRRFAGLVSDPSVWERLYVRHHGTLLHLQFRSFGKNWRWLYRAMSFSVKRGRSDPKVGIASLPSGGWVYCGDLRRGTAHGYGFASRHPIHGDSCQCRSDPHASNLKADGERYEGQWKEGMRYGTGTYVAANGDRYEGQWKDGDMCGDGTFSGSDGSTYRGHWKDGRRHGTGTGTYPTGDRYTGQWSQDTWSGLGELAYADGTQVRGEWDDDELHGRAVTVRANGNRYDRAYVRGAVKGMTVDIYADGSSYVGESDDCKPHGRGAYVWSDGRSYAGCWQHGWYHGNGTMTYADGSRWCGTWEDNQKVEGFVIAHGRMDAVGGGGGKGTTGACECMACSDP